MTRGFFASSFDLSPLAKTYLADIGLPLLASPFSSSQKNNEFTGVLSSSARQNSMFGCFVILERCSQCLS